MKIGVVTAADSEKCRVRVQFPDRDEVVSYWLPVMQKKTLKDKAYWMPDIQEHVVCLMDENDEFGVVLGAIYSDADTPPVDSQNKCHIVFEDGTVIEYDRSAHKLTATVQGDIEVEATGSLVANISGETTITTPTCILNGSLQVNGNINAAGSIIDAGGNTNHHSH